MSQNSQGGLQPASVSEEVEQEQEVFAVPRFEDADQSAPFALHGLDGLQEPRHGSKE